VEVEMALVVEVEVEVETVVEAAGCRRCGSLAKSVLVVTTKI
jgi:hypothetical protein